MKRLRLMAGAMAVVLALASCGRKTVDSGRAEYTVYRTTDLHWYESGRIDERSLLSVSIDNPRINIAHVRGCDTAITIITGDKLSVTGLCESAEATESSLSVVDSVAVASTVVSETTMVRGRRWSMLYYIIVIAVAVAVIRLSSRGIGSRR